MSDRRIRTRELLDLVELYAAPLGPTPGRPIRLGKDALVVDDERGRVTFTRFGAGWMCRWSWGKATSVSIFVDFDEAVEVLQELWPLTDAEAEFQLGQFVDAELTDEDRRELAALRRRLGLVDDEEGGGHG